MQHKSISVGASASLYVIIFFLLGYSSILWYLAKARNKALYLLGTFLFFEILLLTSPTLGDRKIVTKNDTKSGVGYKDATINAVADIKSRDTNFFRIEKDYFSGISRDATYNEAKIQGYFGSRTYNSFSNVNYINFLNCIGELDNLNEESTRWVKGVYRSPNAMRLCSVKYFLTKSASLERYHENFELQNENRDVKTLALKNSLPFGFTYDTYIKKQDFLKFEKSKKQRLILNTVVLDEDLLPNKDFLKMHTSKKNNIVSQRDTLEKINFANNRISGVINSRKSQLLFFSIPFNKGWNLKVDGKNTKLNIVFDGLMGALITAGKHSIELEFKDANKALGTLISVISLLIYLVGISFIYFNTGLKITKTNN